MASIRLGAIVVGISGSISGTTFRRTPRGLIAYNKQARQIKSSQSVNSLRLQIGAIFSSWLSLSEGERFAWAGLASLYPKKDKFGKAVLLTGRQFYTKLATQLLPVKGVLDLNYFDDAVPLSIVESVSIQKGSEKFTVFVSEASTSSNMLVSVYPLRKGANSKANVSVKAIGYTLVQGGGSFDFSPEFWDLYKYAQEGDNYGVNIKFVNSSGFVSPVQSFSIIVT